MSNEQMMNRTPETFGQARERERLEAMEPKVETPVTAEAANAPRTGRIEIPIPSQFGLPAPKFATDGILAGDSSSAAVTATRVPPSADILAEYKAAMAEPELPTAEPSITTDVNPFKVSETLDQLLEASTAAELIRFKKLVIAAFKHLGLDTRKHFGV